MESMKDIKEEPKKTVCCHYTKKFQNLSWQWKKNILSLSFTGTHSLCRVLQSIDSKTWNSWGDHMFSSTKRKWNHPIHCFITLFLKQGILKGTRYFPYVKSYFRSRSNLHLQYVHLSHCVFQRTNISLAVISFASLSFKGMYQLGNAFCSE